MNGTASAMVNSPMIGSCSACSNVRVAPDAIRTRFTNGVIVRSLFFGRQRFSTCKADHHLGFFKLWSDDYTLVKNKTITVPMGTSNGFKVTEDTAFELLNLGETCAY